MMIMRLRCPLPTHAALLTSNLFVSFSRASLHFVSSLSLLFVSVFVSVFRTCRPRCHVLSFSSYVLASMFFHACVFVCLSKYTLLEYSYRLLLSFPLHSFPSFFSFMPFLQSFTGLFLSLPRLDVFVDKLVHIRQYVPLNIYIIFSVAKYLH